MTEVSTFLALQEGLKVKESHTCMWGHEASRVGSSSSGSKSGLSLGGSVLKILELICKKKKKKIVSLFMLSQITLIKVLHLS